MHKKLNALKKLKFEIMPSLNISLIYEEEQSDSISFNTFKSKQQIITPPLSLETFITPTVLQSQIGATSDLYTNKPWLTPGTDITDYFNYGFDEFSYDRYCARQKQIRVEYNTLNRKKNNFK